MQETPESLWRSTLSKAVVTSLAVVGDRLLAAVQAAGPAAQHSECVAFDAQTGVEQWRHRFDYGLINGIKAFHFGEEQEAVAIVTTRSSDLLRGQGGVYAFGSAGEILWRWQTDEKSYSAPVVQGSQVVMMVGDRTLAVVNPEPEGEDVKFIPLPASTSLSAPPVQDHIAYIPCRSPELVAVELDGSVRWHFRLEAGPQAWLDMTPALLADRLFTVSRAGILYCLQALTGERLWQMDIGNGRALSPPTAAQESVFVGSRDGLSVLDSSSGQLRWSLETARPITAVPLVIGDTVYAACQDHNLYALEVETGELRWQYEMARRIELGPVAAGNSLVVIDRGGNIAALPLPEGPVEDAAEQILQAVRQTDKKRRAEAWATIKEPRRAAELWLESGELEKAAGAFETAGAWQEAARVWQQLDRLGKRAEALEQYAVQLGDTGQDDDKTAVAWEQAACAFAEISQREARARCEKEAARYGRQPLLIIEIEPGTMRLNAWSKVDYVIRNEGFGSARQVMVKVVDDRFEGHGQHSQTLVTIRPSSSHRGWLDVLPNAQGDQVPIRLAVEYVDRLGSEHRLQRTFHLPVVGEGDISTAPSLSDSEIFARLQGPDGSNLGLLRRKMVDYFSLNDVHNLIFDLGLQRDDFDSRLSGAVRQVITWAVKHDRYNILIEWCKAQRPGIDW